MIHYSAGGIQCVSLSYSDALLAAGVKASVGTVGDSCDNALVETVNGLYKTELIYSQRIWESISEVEFATMGWVHWWNTSRLHEALDYRTPASVEASCTHPTTTAPATVSPRNETQGGSAGPARPCMMTTSSFSSPQKHRTGSG